MLALTFAWADHGAPAPQLGGSVLCVEPSSVQVRIEGASEASLPAAVVKRVREKLFAAVQAGLEAEGVSYDTGCLTAPRYVLLGLEARFLDPETYLGFPESSYTYVTSAQVGVFTPNANPDTALPERRYTGSASDIFQAHTPEALEARLIALGQAQLGMLTQAWLEANTAAFSSYLRFAALGLALVSLRVLAAFRQLSD